MNVRRMERRRMSAFVLFLIERWKLSKRLCVGRVNKELLEARSNSVEPAINKHSSRNELCGAWEFDIKSCLEKRVICAWNERRHVHEIFSVYIIISSSRPAVWTIRLKLLQLSRCLRRSEMIFNFSSSQLQYKHSSRKARGYPMLSNRKENCLLSSN